MASKCNQAYGVQVLAFLQNLWVRHPERLKEAFELHGDVFRLAMMRRLLLGGCKTGRNLTKAFGDELIARMTFEETTREIAGDPKTIFLPDMGHIQKCLETHQPAIVLAFGQIAHEAVSQVVKQWPGEPIIYIAAHHPVSRHPTSWSSQLRAAAELKERLNNIVHSRLPAYAR